MYLASGACDPSTEKVLFLGIVSLSPADPSPGFSLVISFFFFYYGMFSVLDVLGVANDTNGRGHWLAIHKWVWPLALNM